VSVGLRTSVAAAGVVFATTLAGCSSPTAGEPTSTGDAPSETSTSQQSTDGADPTTSAEPSFTNTQLCGLLNSDEAVQLGGSATGKTGYSTMDGHPQCSWRNETVLVVGFQENGVSGNDPTGPDVTNTPTTVAGYPAVQSLATDPIDICQMLVDVTDKAVIGVAASIQSSGEGKYVPCDVAKALAEIVIPKAMQR
jgi:hypothetical protein